MTFGARNGKFWQQTNCQDSKLASKFFLHPQPVAIMQLQTFEYLTILVEKPFLVWTSVAHCWKDSRSKGMKYQDVTKMFHIVGDLSHCESFTMKESFMFDVAKYLKRTSTRFSFLAAQKSSILQHDFSSVQTFELLKGRNIYEWMFKTRKASQLKVEI